jgi:translation initiation factor 2B subunit (eIF-2B alpha/beta/delta family)
MYVRFDVILIESDPRDEASVLYHHLKDAIAERAG